jgi:very-short-patch-repair endonuclease
LDVAEVDRILARGGRRGAARLRAILMAWRSASRSRRQKSRLEAWLLSALLEAGLPQPECNVVLEIAGERFEIDLFWPQRRLAVETDGEETHATPAAFQRDRRRDQILTAAGYRPTRVTWRQMEDEAGDVLARIARMLER